MRQYQRFMSSASQQPEHAALERVLRSAPGVSEVAILGEHPKGGYRTQFELAPESLATFISYLEANGWRPVL